MCQCFAVRNVTGVYGINTSTTEPLSGSSASQKVAEDETRMSVARPGPEPYPGRGELGPAGHASCYVGGGRGSETGASESPTLSLSLSHDPSPSRRRTQ